MLLEVQNISKAAVVLGNTWVVNAVIISGVLVMILLANLVPARLPRLPAGPVYALLVASCLGLYFLDLSTFAFLPYATKALVVGAADEPADALQRDRLHAVVRGRGAEGRGPRGEPDRARWSAGCCRSVTFVIGIKALLLDRRRPLHRSDADAAQGEVTSCCL